MAGTGDKCPVVIRALQTARPEPTWHGDPLMINPAAAGDSSRLGTWVPQHPEAGDTWGPTGSHIPWDRGHTCIGRQRVMSMEWGQSEASTAPH